MDTRTTIKVALLAALSTSTATTVPLKTFSQTSGTEIVLSQKIIGTNAFLSQDAIIIEKRKKSYRERYKRIRNGIWFDAHYNNKSLGEIAEIVD